MHKKIVSGILFAAVALSVASPVLATEGSASVRASATVRPGIFRAIREKVRDVKDRIEQKHEDTQEHRAEVKAEVKDRLEASRANRLKNWYAGVQRRLTAMVDRMRKLDARIQARITALAAEGKNVTEAQAALVDARAKVNVAATALTNMTAQVDVIISTNTPKDAFKKLHDLHKDVLVKMKDAHRALVKALTLTVRAKASVTASPTPTATPTN